MINNKFSNLNLEQLKNDLIENPINRSIPNCYKELSIKYNVSTEYVRSTNRSLIKKGLVPDRFGLTPLTKGVALKINEYKETRKPSGEIEITDYVDRKLSDDELFERYGRSKNEWKINMVWFKDTQNGFKLSVCFAPTKENKKIFNYQELFKQFVSNNRKINYDLTFLKNEKYLSKQIENALVLSLADLHIDLKSFEGETGFESSITKSIEKAKLAATDIIYRAANSHGLEKIIIIGGNDFFHANSAQNTTEKGTKLDVDGRWNQSFKIGLELMSNIIDLASTFAPVEYYTCYGNHSPEREFYLAVAIEALYRSNSRVFVETGESERKYFSYGNSAFMLSHDATKNIKDCPILFITEQPQLYANAKYRFLLTGHLHSKFETSFIGTSENFGLLWKRLPSMAHTDKWHYQNAFVGNQKACIGIVINKNFGEIAEYTYNS